MWHRAAPAAQASEAPRVETSAADTLAEARRLWGCTSKTRENALLRIQYTLRVCACAVTSMGFCEEDADAVNLLLTDCAALCDVALFAEE